MHVANRLQYVFTRLGLAQVSINALCAHAAAPRILVRGDSLIREGDPEPGMWVLLDGYLKTFRLLDCGACQTLGLFTPDDICGAACFGLGIGMDDTYALTRCTVTSIPRDCAEAVMGEFPEVTSALWAVTARENRISKQWMIGLGQRRAPSRLAHFLCEIAVRSRFVQGPSVAYRLPLSQIELAEVLGMSVVHVNRSMQALRNAKLICLDRAQLRIMDWDGLAALGDFDQAYLSHGRFEPHISCQPQIRSGGETLRSFASHAH